MMQRLTEQSALQHAGSPGISHVHTAGQLSSNLPCLSTCENIPDCSAEARLTDETEQKHHCRLDALET